MIMINNSIYKKKYQCKLVFYNLRNYNAFKNTIRIDSIDKRKKNSYRNWIFLEKIGNNKPYF